jgi:hypothetical protein
MRWDFANSPDRQRPCPNRLISNTSIQKVTLEGLNARICENGKRHLFWRLDRHAKHFLKFFERMNATRLDLLFDAEILSTTRYSWGFSAEYLARVEVLPGRCRTVTIRLDFSEESYKINNDCQIERSRSVAMLAVAGGVRRLLGSDFDEEGWTVGGMGSIGNDSAVVAQLRKL